MAAWFGREARDERRAIEFVADMSNDPEGTRPALEAWLAADPRRRPVYDHYSYGLTRSTELLATRPRPPLAPAPTRTPIRARRRRVAVALGIIVALFALAVFLGSAATPDRRDDPDRRSEAGALRATGALAAATGHGERRRIRLADGTRVLLDANSAIATTFTPSQRLVTLVRGRARFDVAHEPARPFRVRASGGEVVARGTLFDVWIRPDRQVRVVLLRGAVDITPPPASTGSDPGPNQGMIRLAPGQRLAYGAGIATPADAQPRAATKSETDWMNETIDFDDVPLAELLLEANRHGPPVIELENAGLGTIEIFGSFQIRDTRKLARRLADSLDLDLVQTGDRLILSSPERAPVKRR